MKTRIAWSLQLPRKSRLLLCWNRMIKENRRVASTLGRLRTAIHRCLLTVGRGGPLYLNLVCIIRLPGANHRYLDFENWTLFATLTRQYASQSHIELHQLTTMDVCPWKVSSAMYAEFISATCHNRTYARHSLLIRSFPCFQMIGQPGTNGADQLHD
jgi:hypothetical protein